jgi:sortase (surface protein transpeptidase)
MKIFKVTLTILAVLAGLFLLGRTLYGSVFYAADDGSSIPAPQTAAVETAIGNVKGAATVTRASTSTLPVLLTIPSLDIKAKVQYVGVNAKGNMGTPNNFKDVSWYKPGAVPGEVGSAVMAGHVDNGLALSGVFKHLEDIQVGEVVEVERKDGVKLKFIVEAVKMYPYKDVPVASVFTSKSGAHLNLVTCVGAWIPGQKTYDQRLVVYTTLVN